MEWDSHKIKSLRRRLGWSQSDLARRLKTESISVISWEEGTTSPPRTEAQILELLLSQAELSSLEISQTTQVELTMSQRELESLNLQSLESADKD